MKRFQGWMMAGILLSGAVLTAGCGEKTEEGSSAAEATTGEVIGWSTISDEEMTADTETEDTTSQEEAGSSESGTESTEESTESSTEAVTEDAVDAAKEESGQYLVAIDPGHQAPDVDMSATEPNGPGSSVMKAKATGGTQGTTTGVGEYALNLDISLQLRDALEEDGYQVLLTREDNETAISNAERAQKATDAGADIYLRIHANGSTDSSAHGALALIGSQDNQWVGDLYDDSYRLAEDILDAYCDSTGMYNRGIQTTDTMTGINWSTMPVTILEMGFMTNPTDDVNMEDPDYQKKMVSGIVTGIDAYLGIDRTEVTQEEGQETNEKQEDASASSDASSLQSEIESFLNTSSSGGGEVSVSAGLIAEGEDGEALVNDHAMQAASLIKLYICGCVYENIDDVLSQESWSGETRQLLVNMITISDNDAANTLVSRLGDGDSSAGMAKVNAYCRNHGYTDTSMGRLLLASNANGDNYTSVSDCASFLRDVYNGNLDGSGKMLELLMSQQRRSKIPAGVPSGVTVANKTGELSDVENDAAIVFSDGGDYVLVVMSQDLYSTSSEVEQITQISSLVYDYFND